MGSDIETVDLIRYSLLIARKEKMLKRAVFASFYLHAQPAQNNAKMLKLSSHPSMKRYRALSEINDKSVVCMFMLPSCRRCTL